jgi:hypothetical protein
VLSFPTISLLKLDLNLLLLPLDILRKLDLASLSTSLAFLSQVGEHFSVNHGCSILLFLRIRLGLFVSEDVRLVASDVETFLQHCE